MNFDALDNQPVNLVMLFLVPQGQFQKHLHTLANIAGFYTRMSSEKHWSKLRAQVKCTGVIRRPRL
jgi:mannitol/fructose-specific phosphotransferase system IIA component (Ntr-type)